MSGSRRDIVRLALLATAVVALLLLAMSLSRLEMGPGVPFAQIWQFLVDQLRRDGIAGPMAGTPPVNETLIAVFRTLFLIVLLMFPIAVIMILIDRDMRRRVLASIVRLAIIFALLGLFVESQAERAEETVESALGGQLEGEDLDVSSFTDEEFDESNVSRWIVWGLSLLAGLALAAVVVVFVNRARLGANRRGEPWTELASQAQATILEIQSGGDLRSSILRCYVEMNRIVRESRGVRRASTMTAREFREHLVNAKLPAGPVARLTELFERARYGVGDATAQEETDALDSLQAIADACRSLA